MSGYLDFKGAYHATNAIAKAINDAGDSYHHTSQWSEENLWDPSIPPPADAIQKAIIDADQFIEYMRDALYESYVMRGMDQEGAMHECNKLIDTWYPK